MINTVISVYRGDSIKIPIIAPLTEGAIYRAQLRVAPESVNYYTLLIVDNKMIVNTSQSESLTQGT